MSNTDENQSAYLTQIIGELLQQINSSGSSSRDTRIGDDHISVNITLYDLSGGRIEHADDDSIDVESISSSDSDSEWNNYSFPINATTTTTQPRESLQHPFSGMQSSPPERPSQSQNLSSISRLFNTIDNSTQRQNETDYRRRYAIMLNNIILAYNENMIEYHRNMNALIHVANSVSGFENGAPSPIALPSTASSSSSPAISPTTATPGEGWTTASRVQPRETRLNGIIQRLRSRHLNYPERTNIYRQYQGMPDIFSLISREEATQRQPFSREEINQLTRLVQYTSNMGETRCPISLEDFEPEEMVRQINICGHVFNARVLEEWLMSSPLHICCPICRCDMRRSTGNSRP